MASLRFIDSSPDARRLTARILAEEEVHPGALTVSRPILETAVQRARLVGADVAQAHITGVPACRVCGCTDLRPCRGGCGWVERDLCTVCAQYPEGPS